MYGIWVEEIDALYDDEYNQTELNGKKFRLNTLCEIIHTVEARIISYYEKDFYKNEPVITVNEYGLGKAYYIASNSEKDLIDELMALICDEALIESKLEKIDIPNGIGVVSREDDKKNIIFMGNFSEEKQSVQLDELVDLAPYEMKIFIRDKTH